MLGPIYVAWNTALRLYDENPTLLYDWQTSISILYSAVFKLSFLSKPGKVYRYHNHHNHHIFSLTIIIIITYRGVNESRMKLPEAFYKQDNHDFAGGVELAFMSTSYDINVAIEYGGRGHHYYYY